MKKKPTHTRHPAGEETDFKKILPWLTMFSSFKNKEKPQKIVEPLPIIPEEAPDDETNNTPKNR